MAVRASLNVLLLALACSQSAFAQDSTAASAALTVGAGDTATALAQKLRPESATLEQTLVALWRANPHAFGNGNLNQLLQGATLQVPSERDILRLPAAQAHVLVVEQVENFQAFARLQHRPAPATSPAVTGLDVTQWARALAEAQALKDALERQSRDTQTQLAQIEKNIQSLQAIHAASNPAPAASAAAEAAFKPASEAPAPEPKTSSPASKTAPAAVATHAPTLSSRWLWTGALLAFMLMLILMIRRHKRMMSSASAATIEIPPQMAGIDLNLDSPPSGTAGHQDRRP